jgi:hypothetical protein
LNNLKTLKNMSEGIHCPSGDPDVPKFEDRKREAMERHKNTPGCLHIQIHILEIDQGFGIPKGYKIEEYLLDKNNTKVQIHDEV